jgi:hypothetical protein
VQRLHADLGCRQRHTAPNRRSLGVIASPRNPRASEREPRVCRTGTAPKAPSRGLSHIREV